MCYFSETLCYVSSFQSREMTIKSITNPTLTQNTLIQRFSSSNMPLIQSNEQSVSKPAIAPKPALTPKPTIAPKPSITVIAKYDRNNNKTVKDEAMPARINEMAWKLKNAFSEMSESEIQCKCAIYEIISSQHNFITFLTITVKTFVNSPMLLGSENSGCCINLQQRKQLFLNIIDIRDINKR